MKKKKTPHRVTIYRRHSAESIESREMWPPLRFHEER